MKSLRLLTAGAWFSFAVQPIHGASEAEREFERLTKQRDQAIAQLAEPVNKQYEASLTALMRKAAAADDYETALKIKQVLAQFEEERDRARVAGTWDFLNKADGHTGTLEFKSDKRLYSGDQRLGVWDVKGKQLMVTYDNREIGVDVYSLPPREGEMSGTNRHGHALFLKRKTD
jgi:hypothetical protein